MRQLKRIGLVEVERKRIELSLPTLRTRMKKRYIYEICLDDFLHFFMTTSSIFLIKEIVPLK